MSEQPTLRGVSVTYNLHYFDASIGRKTQQSFGEQDYYSERFRQILATKIRDGEFYELERVTKHTETVRTITDTEYSATEETVERTKTYCERIL